MQASSADEDGFGPAEVAQLTGVCEATLERVGAFLTLLEAHRSRLNLIGPREQGRIWRRHVLDSLQLAPLISLKRAQKKAPFCRRRSPSWACPPSC